MDWAIHNWQDISSISTVIGIFASFITIFFIYIQIKSQSNTSLRSTALDIRIRFSQMFQEATELYRSLRSRSDSGNGIITRDECMIYYNKYWIMRLLEFDYFIYGLIPIETYSAWVENSVRQIDNKRNLSCIENGNQIIINSRDVFENYVLNDLYLRHEKCRNFYIGILNICIQLEQDGVPLDSDPAFSRIRHHINKVRRPSLRPFN